MKLTLSKTILGLSLIHGTALADAQIEPGVYQIDPMHSKVGFEIPHLVISTVEGGFREFTGSVELAKDFTKSKVKAEIAVGSIDTGVAKRDDHLRSADFFDASNHPKMVYESVKIRGTPKAFVMEGDLSIRGVKKRVTFDGKYLGSVTDGYGQRKAAFTAKTRINRKDFGLVWSAMVEAGPVVGDDVTIELKIQAARPAENSQAAR